MGPLTQNGLEQGGLARAVWANDRHNLAAMDVQVDVPEDRAAVGDHPQAGDLKTAGVVAAVAAVLVDGHENASKMVVRFRSMASR